MKFVPAKCPSCNGDLQIPDDREFVKCMYCGVDIKVREVLNLRYDVNIPNLLKLGNSLIEAGNTKKAIDTFNKILENAAENYEAWFGLGFAYRDGDYATYADENPANYFSNAIKYAPDEKKYELKMTILRKYAEYEMYENSDFTEYKNKLIDDLIEEDSNNYELWMFKGVSCDIYSLKDDYDIEKLKNIISAFSNAVKYSPVDIVDEVKNKISDNLYRQIISLFHYVSGDDRHIIELEKIKGEAIYKWILEIVEYADSLISIDNRWNKLKNSMCKDVINYYGYRYQGYNLKFYKNKLKEYKKD
jgi:tetratricopeptide (TPR) repeat protein